LLLKPASLVFAFLLGTAPFNTVEAQPKEHIVIILGSAYFPQKTSVEAGDTVRFVNVSGNVHSVTSAAGFWTTGPMDEDEEHIILIRPEMTGQFRGWAKRMIVGQLDLIRTPPSN
jgi:plastocyanin